MTPEIEGAIFGVLGSSALWTIGVVTKLITSRRNGKITKEDIRGIVDPKFEIVFNKFDSLKCTEHAEKIGKLEGKLTK